ncbi:hypothetical protein ACU6CN_001582, partial [Listeria monocytogenes]
NKKCVENKTYSSQFFVIKHHKIHLTELNYPSRMNQTKSTFLLEMVRFLTIRVNPVSINKAFSNKRR